MHKMAYANKMVDYYTGEVAYVGLVEPERARELHDEMMAVSGLFASMAHFDGSEEGERIFAAIRFIGEKRGVEFDA